MASFTEENYLKAIYSLAGESTSPVSTNALASKLGTKASSVTDMIKKLATKELVNYKRYQGVSLTTTGSHTALRIIRKHRLWEVFLVEKLSFKWDEVHDIAEQLEHIISPELTHRLDTFLGNPKYDPHGDPIPDVDGKLPSSQELSIAELLCNEPAQIIGVKDTSPNFLKYLEKQCLLLGTQIVIEEHREFDGSRLLKIGGDKQLAISQQVSKNLYVKRL